MLYINEKSYLLYYIEILYEYVTKQKDKKILN